MRVLWASLAVVVADQLTKAWVVAMMEVGDTIPVVGEWLRLTYFENDGIAFGWAPGAKPLLTAVAALATGMVAVYLVWMRAASRGYRLALALILGGAVGNLIDRLFYGLLHDYAPFGYGRVVDFLHLDVYHGFVELPWRAYPAFVALFPVANLADVAIIGGLGLVLVAHVRLSRREAAPAPALPAPDASASPSAPDASPSDPDASASDVATSGDPAPPSEVDASAGETAGETARRAR